MTGSFSIFQIHHGQYLYQRFEIAARRLHETRQTILCCLQTHLKIIYPANITRKFRRKVYHML